MSATPRPPDHGVDPVLVEVVRGRVVESVHHGAVVVCDANGDLVYGCGEIHRPVFPRSAVKPLQALPLVETGAADRFGLGETELALACASHSGEAHHVAAVQDWLTRLGLTETDLECGGHPPLDAAAARALAASGGPPSPLYNNCSGKHAGMLTTARHLGEPTRGYIGVDHPVQRRIAQVLAEMTDSPADHTPWATDGCGIPTYALPLSGVAVAMARLADPTGLGETRRQAVLRLRAAMAARPDLVAGSGRLCTEVMRIAPSVLIKGGAEGVYAAVFPKRGLGVALKIADGAGRAAEVAILAVLRHLGAFTAEEEEHLRQRSEPPLVNAAGTVVGHLRPAAVWLE